MRDKCLRIACRSITLSPGRLVLLLPLLLLLLSGGPAPAGGATLDVTPSNPRQAEALFVRLRGVDGVEEPRVTWLGKSYPLRRLGENWGAVVPISPDVRAGGHTLVVTFDRGASLERLARKVEVQRVAFPVQHLRMARQTASLYNYPGVDEREERPLSAALRVKTDERLWSGEWVLPVKGRLSTPFGVRRIRNGRAVGRHRGADIAAPTGTPIVAPAAGRVVLAEPASRFRKYGGTVVLDHGQGLTSMYIHMSAVTAREEQVLRRGEELGRVGEEGVATGPHLHWSVYVQGTPVGPLFFCRLGKRGIRF